MLPVAAKYSAVQTLYTGPGNDAPLPLSSSAFTVVSATEAITAAGQEVAKSEVRLPLGALRELGEYEVDVQLHSDVTIAVKLSVVAAAE